MVKVEFGLLRYLEEEDFRVLVALEMCMRNHDVAPTVLIERIAQLPHGGARKRLNNLLKFKVIHHESLCYDGFSMKYAAYDFLALRTFVKRGTLSGIGTRIGCGKESDIMTVVSPDGHESVMKLQRLGRCSFRTVARNRDYKGNGKQRRGESWFYLSRLAATKEFAFMKLLYDEGFPVPKPIDHNRHAVVMERVNGTLLNHIQDMSGHAQKVYERILNLMVKLAQHGLIHGDFNEFNTFVTDEFKIVLIDFPQMVSTDHPNASELFDRDVNNLALFFQRRHKIEKVYFPKLESDVERTERFDQRLAASGAFTKQQQKDLEMLMHKEASDEEDEEEEEEEDDAEAPELAPVEGGDAPKPKPTTSLLPVAGEGAQGKGKHVDPSGPSLTIAALAARTAEGTKPAPAGADAAAADDDAASDVSSNAGAAHAAEETRSVAPTIASTAATLAKRILAKQRADNANFRGDSTELDKEHIWKRTKARAQHNENVQFNRQMHRNSLKGKQKRRVDREIARGDHPTTIFDM
uniref:Serine/threonine-protein kinase RIO2 n=1 Tax=Neobodo designis TaxID=312471 RepID=A0A7S1PZP3_NEODS|mmetsp:Transcript_26846/g.83041  ORF Transcript_26846/g.83041 Transcript_26846/m.83041 type:complete len:522 (+) Transcript_26846:152-1717(+)|eukprot:CAMPEP_0174855842 /NCGR_PEP_ID=MMETSP1114-20130205/34354_1 /TAXON_ID=312471 /ORGANISM="Neobodo designis, Strain CCAP 1951/1" /LENGTH=521 /DNA_ID=CAMNT_0016090613 /DNA_START=154 /DNA_END=1719 /DNA_ORIENTATION=+